jgi:radical SAM superfamily enzyme YgiQ (UPF0313 family)
MFEAIEKLRRSKKSSMKIIVGGPQTTVAIQAIPEYVDFIVQGEGEEAILDIINARTKERIIKKPRIKDLDSLPFQPWDIFSKLPYHFSGPWLNDKIEPIFTMNTSRGCPLSCTFCAVSSIWGKEYYGFSADRIIFEIEYLIKNHGAKGIFFREDNFTFDRKRTVEFCEKLIKKNIDITWICEARVDSLCDEELVKLMRASGCRAVYLGVESGSQRVLDILSKGITVEQIENAVNLCKKHNINTYCSLLAGVPEETYSDYLLTKRMMDKLVPFHYMFHVVKGVPRSPLYNHMLQNRLYEYIDDIGIVYPPGFDIKSKFFYRKDSSHFVKYRFRQRTQYDKSLLRELRLEKIDKILNCVDRYFSYLPAALVRIIIKIKLLLKNILFRIFV